MTNSARKYVSIWLFIGLIMVFFQVIIGGITRLTDSGLSITEWELIKGVLPPTNEVAWQEAFDKYQTFAKQQFEQLHADMSLSEFKKIYFWEYFHRLWARSMGFVFLFPFIFFLIKKWIPKWLAIDLAVVVGLAALAAAFGWIMVASGLNEDNRTWVSAYKLVIHLSIAALLFAKLYWTYLKTKNGNLRDKLIYPQVRKWSVWLCILVFIQIAFGGLMAGMRAGSIHPHWPFFMGNNFLFEALFNSDKIDATTVINYEGSLSIKAFVQVLHRAMAVLLMILSIVYFVAVRKLPLSASLKRSNLIFLFVLFVQVVLGILTITKIVGNSVPVVLGVVHQGVALILFGAVLSILFQTKNNSDEKMS